MLLILLAFVLWFHGIALHPGSRISAGFGDGTSTIRDYWAASAEHRNPFDFTHDAYDGAPQGLARAPATLLANAGLQTAFVWSATGLLGPVGAWNAFLFPGFLGTGIAMFALLDRLGCTFVASVFGAYVVAFCPYALERAYAGHLGLLQNWVFVLLVAVLLRLSVRRSAGAAALVGGSLAVAFYASAYQGLLASLAAAVYLLVELIRCGGTPERVRTLALGGGAYLVALVALTPILVLYAEERATVVETAGHQAGELGRYAAGLRAYLLPSPRNPLFHWLRGIHGGLTEETLYCGYTTCALAVAAAVLVRRRDSWLAAVPSRRRVTVFALALAPAAFVMSLPPHYGVGGLAIPAPSLALGRVSTYYRVYSRFGFLVGFALAILAALALTVLARRGRRALRFVPVLALALAAVELLPGNAGVLDANAQPGWDHWLASQPTGIVATYPLPIGPAHAGDLAQADDWYERFDRDPRFAIYAVSRAVSRSRDQAIRLVARDLGQPLTARVLATEGVRYVVVHAAAYRADGQRVPTLDPQQYRLLKRFGSVSIYAVAAPHTDVGRALAEHARQIALLEGFVAPSLEYVDGFNRPEPYGGSTGRWLIQGSVIRIHDDTEPMKIVVSALVFSNGRPRTLELRDGAGRLLGRRLVPTHALPLRFGPFPVRRGTTTLTLYAYPGPVQLGARDPRQASVFLAYLGLVPMPAYS